LSASLRIEEAGSTRRLSSQDLPLALGGPESDLSLSGISAPEPVAYLGLSEGELFVQPGGGPARPACNGAPLSTSQWLREGDVLRVGSTEITVRYDAEGPWLSVAHAVEDNPTEPPLIAVPASTVPARGSPEPLVRPIAFQPQTLTGTRRRRLSLRPMAVLGWALAAGALVLGWFVFTARSVRVEIEPSPDRVWFEGGLLRLGLAERYLLRPGRYVVRAEKAGYQALEASVEVTEAAHQVLSFELPKLPGTLAIDVGGVAGVSVLIDGGAVGETPLAPLELTPGEHALIFRSERYQELATTVTIEGGGEAQSLKLELVPNWAEITFDSRPQGAEVRVDGQTVGETPVTTELLAGARAVELVRPGWKPYARRLKVVAGEPQTLPTMKLQPADGNLVLTSEPAGATVEVDGAFRGRTPLDLQLAPGRSHELRVSKLGHDSQSLEVSLTSKQRKTLSITLVPRLGEVRVEALPADAELLLDGEPRGRATQVLELNAVPHAFEIRREGYQSHRQNVTPRPGFPQSLRVRLEPVGPAEAEKTLPRRITSSEGLELRLIEGGRFQMGAPRREPGRRANESLREVEHPPLGPGERSEPGGRSPSRRARDVGAGGRLLQLAEQERIAASRLSRAGRPLGGDRAAGHGLPPAHRGRVGLGRPLPGRPHGPQVSLGPIAAHPAALRQLRRRLRPARALGRPARLRRPLPGHRSGRCLLPKRVGLV